MRPGCGRASTSARAAPRADRRGAAGDRRPRQRHDRRRAAPAQPRGPELPARVAGPRAARLGRVHALARPGAALPPPPAHRRPPRRPRSPRARAGPPRSRARERLHEQLRATIAASSPAPGAPARCRATPPSQAFSVRCDDAAQREAAHARGEVVVEIGLAVRRRGEFRVLRIAHRDVGRLTSRATRAARNCTLTPRRRARGSARRSGVGTLSARRWGYAEVGRHMSQHVTDVMVVEAHAVFRQGLVCCLDGFDGIGRVEAVAQRRRGLGASRARRGRGRAVRRDARRRRRLRLERPAVHRHARRRACVQGSPRTPCDARRRGRRRGARARGPHAGAPRPEPARRRCGRDDDARHVPQHVPPRRSPPVPS